MNFDNYLFRCSQLGKLMTNDQSGKNIGKTCLSYLNECYIAEVYKRTNEVSTKFMEKGTLVEQVSVTLLSNVDNKLYTTYKGKPLKNDNIKGTPDIIQGIDIKSSWNIHTFFNAELTKDNEWQARGYMWLTGIEKWDITYCLVSAPEHLIDREERSLFFKMGVDSEDNPDFQIAKAELRRNMTFDDIPEAKRVKRFTVAHDEAKIELLKERVIKCREILNEMYKQNK